MQMARLIEIMVVIMHLVSPKEIHQIKDYWRYVVKENGGLFAWRGLDK